MTLENITHSLDIISFVCNSKCLITPAQFDMSTEVAGGTGITGIEETTDKPCPVVARASSALKDMCFAIIKILYGSLGFEEHIDQCIPFFREMIY